MISAKEQMQWQERLSNTAHVREVEDLKAAGLNPVLSAGGSGASTPAGSIDPISSAETSGVSSGKGYRRRSGSDPNSLSAIIKATGEQISKAMEKVYDSSPSSAKQNNDLSKEASSEGDASENGFFARVAREMENKNADAANMQAKALSVFGIDPKDLNRSVPIIGKFGVKWKDVFGGYFKRAAELKHMYNMIFHPDQAKLARRANDADWAGNPRHR